MTKFQKLPFNQTKCEAIAESKRAEKNRGIIHGDGLWSESIRIGTIVNQNKSRLDRADIVVPVPESED